MVEERKFDLGHEGSSTTKGCDSEWRQELSQDISSPAHPDRSLVRASIVLCIRLLWVYFILRNSKHTGRFLDCDASPEEPG